MPSIQQLTAADQTFKLSLNPPPPFLAFVIDAAVASRHCYNPGLPVSFLPVSIPYHTCWLDLIKPFLHTPLQLPQPLPLLPTMLVGCRHRHNHTLPPFPLVSDSQLRRITLLLVKPPQNLKMDPLYVPLLSLMLASTSAARCHHHNANFTSLLRPHPSASWYAPTAGKTL